eukprot:317501-Chlamydomonas_euryale.AAC.1
MLAPPPAPSSPPLTSVLLLSIPFPSVHACTWCGQGRGRGNAFLNDLTDADVLIHVVDASGRSDREGNVLQADEGVWMSGCVNVRGCGQAGRKAQGRHAAGK